MGKPYQICQKQVIYKMLKLFEHYVREQEECPIGLSQLYSKLFNQSRFYMGYKGFLHNGKPVMIQINI